MEVSISAKNFVKINKEEKRKARKFKERTDVKQRQTKPFKNLHTK
jgi:hypothetical protein